MGTAFWVLISVMGDLLRWLGLSFRSTKSTETENLFLRRQLAPYVERGIKPRRIDPVRCELRDHGRRRVSEAGMANSRIT